MIHLPNNRKEVIDEMSRLHGNTLSRDDVLQIILKMDFLHIPFGPQYIQEHFGDFYRAGVTLFGSWNDLLNFTGIIKMTWKYYGNDNKYLPLSSEQEYRNYFMSKLHRINVARLQLHKRKREILLLPVFPKDEPIIMTSGKKTRQWLEMLYRNFPSLFRIDDRSSEWFGNTPNRKLPKLSTITGYIQKNGDVVRRVMFGEEVVKIILWKPKEKESHEIE